MKYIKSFAARAAAFVVSIILFAACIYSFFNVAKDYERLWDRSGDYLSSSEYVKKVRDLYNQLWLTGNMYLRCLDGNGELTGSEELKKSIENQLYEKGITDYKGNFCFNDDNSKLEYCVFYKDKMLTNMEDKSKAELTDYFEQSRYSYIYTDGSMPENIYKEVGSGYSYIYTDGSMNINEELHNFFDDDCRWYSTNYGMYYYECGNYSAAVFDYDTENLDSYVDGRGVRIYYKTDGTTPIPISDYADSYDSYQHIEDSEDIPEYVEVTQPVTALGDEGGTYSEDDIKDGFLIYNKDEGKWIKVNNDSFITIPGDSRPLTIYIKPVNALIGEHEQLNLRYESEKKHAVGSIMNLIPVAATFLIFMLFALYCDGYSVREGKYKIYKSDRIYAEILLILIAAAITVFIWLFDIERIRELSFIHINNASWYYCGIMVLLYVIFYALLSSLLRRIKCKCFWKTTLIGKLCSVIHKRYIKLKRNILSRESLKNDIFTRRFLIRLAVFSAAEVLISIITFACMLGEAGVICMVLLMILFAFLSCRELHQIEKLSEQITAMCGGDYTEREAEEGSAIYGMTEKLNNISGGIQTAVEKRISSERMKIDLVTNISHDLKTPLTSIISYVNLLSMEELTPEAGDYVKVLEQKTERLKTIVSDLFDLAKATSNTDIKAEKIDAVILIGQVLADMNDKIESYGREIRTVIAMESAPVFAEGKKLYRVLQNLIDNALKYSLDGTRIYIRLYENDGKAVVSVKNISSYEMKFSPEEITERFTRGDESRTSEGSGLGLSIAKSFTEACGGEFAIKIDDDVFTAEMKFEILHGDSAEQSEQ